MINQKLQDFEEEVKPLGDIMTQVQSVFQNRIIFNPSLQNLQIN
jgi:hypothetical protein